VISVNDPFCKLAGYSREELIGLDLHLLGSEQHQKSYFRELRRTIANGIVWHGEISIRAMHGSPYWLAATIVPFLDSNERPRQFVAIGADITEQKRLRAC
jgi:PAS domain S-box-containing protein